MDTSLPFTKQDVERIAERYPTPFYLYDEAGIRSQARYLQETMDAAHVPGFRNFFAVKALPNPSILRVLHEEGMGLDCSSLAELRLAERIGISGDGILFTSNNTTLEEYALAHDLGAVINFDDVSHIRLFLDNIGAPTIACCRYNPGDMTFPGVDQHIIGQPAQAKFGMPQDQMVQAYRELRDAGVTRFGLHGMLLSNDLDYRNHLRIADALFGFVARLHQELGITFEFIDLGGGIGVPYRPGESSFDLAAYADGLVKLYRSHELQQLGAPKIYMENGRWVTAEAGYLITRVIHRKNAHKRYVGTDATMANLMRPGMYGAYHHITVLGHGKEVPMETVDVVGSLCENNDKFAIDRELPMARVGDHLVIHAAGAHGHAMGFNYNGKLRSAELLLRPDGGVRLIRRAETLDDLFATLVD